MDSRFDAVSEDRRRELFEMYKSMLSEEAPHTHSAAQVRPPACLCACLCGLLSIPGDPCASDTSEDEQNTV